MKAKQNSEKEILGVRHVSIDKAAEIIGMTIPQLRWKIRADKQAIKEAQKKHKPIPEDGVPFYQAMEGAAIWFPVPGLEEFVSKRTFGMKFKK